MTIFSWFNKSNGDRTAEPDSSGLSRIDSTRPVAGGRDAKEPPAGSAQPANRKSERMARRELLYTVVRETMTRAGVLSSSYKFKVLSLDARARQFLVMVDLVPVQGIDAPHFGEVEAMIAQSAKNRHEIIVTAVYWRMHDPLAIGSTASTPVAVTGRSEPFAAQTPAARMPAPLGVEARTALAATAPAVSATGVAGAADAPGATLRAALADAPRTASQTGMPAVAAAPGGAATKAPRSNAEEVAEFRRALAAGLTRPAGAGAATTATGATAAGGVAAVVASVAAAVRPAVAHASPPARSFDGDEVRGPQSYTLLTGFEDTELGDSKGKLRSLSGSQFGDLN